MLTRELPLLLPGSLAFGEEAAHDDPTMPRRYFSEQPAPVWIRWTLSTAPPISWHGARMNHLRGRDAGAESAAGQLVLLTCARRDVIPPLLLAQSPSTAPRSRPQVMIPRGRCAGAGPDGRSAKPMKWPAIITRRVPPPIRPPCCLRTPCRAISKDFKRAGFRDLGNANGGLWDLLGGVMAVRAMGGYAAMIDGRDYVPGQQTTALLIARNRAIWEAALPIAAPPDHPVHRPILAVEGSQNRSKLLYRRRFSVYH